MAPASPLSTASAVAPAVSLAVTIAAWVSTARVTGYGYGNGYGGGAGNAASISNGLTAGYVPDPVGADIPPLIIPTNCWVRRAAYDPSGAYFGQVLVNLCRPSDSVTVAGLKARPKTLDTGAGTQPPPVHRPGSPQLPQ